MIYSDKMAATDGRPYIVINDNADGYNLQHFCIPKQYDEDLDSVLLPAGLIADRIDRLAQDVIQDFGVSLSDPSKSPEPLACICVLKGAYQFFTDLVRRIEVLSGLHNKALPISLHFIRLKSYVNESSTGKVQLKSGDDLSTYKGKNVLVVEDIIDTGNTMIQFLDMIKEQKPRKVKVASLLLKRTSLAVGYKPDYLGFEIPDKFVVGFGLDYNEVFRGLGHVCVISEKGKKKYAIS